MRVATGIAVLLPMLPPAGPALAAGGAHFIDDAAVETPGSCHLESWVTHSRSGEGFVNSAPACTRLTWPNLELGGFVAHNWTNGADETVIGLSPKLVLRSEERGVGIGIATSVGYGIDRKRIEAASLAVPVTIPAGEKLRFNLNAGWLWARAGRHHDVFVGAQAEVAVGTRLNLMVETFTRNRGKMGGQAGLRWTVAGGAVDLDLIGGRFVDGTTPMSVTFGVTIRSPVRN